MTDIMTAVVKQEFGTQDDSQGKAALNSAYRYLRVAVQGRPAAFLVLGYVDAHPQGDIEVWYSARQEVIKMQNGRIIGTAGLEVDWRAVQYPIALPSWAALPTTGITFQRTRDEIPGHRYGVTETIELRPWSGVPPTSLPDALNPDKTQRYSWFRESVQTSTVDFLPPAWFAWGVYRGTPTVVYSEQCLTNSFCLKLQRWPLPESAL